VNVVTLRAAERNAWSEYLDVTRTAALTNQWSYAEVEAWAWARLQERLLAIHRKRERTAA
jgi:hypothetical protein